jgi:hypothetical protein
LKWIPLLIQEPRELNSADTVARFCYWDQRVVGSADATGEARELHLGFGNAERLARKPAMRATVGWFGLGGLSHAADGCMISVRELAKGESLVRM